MANSWARPHLAVQTCPDPRSWFWGWQGSQIGSNLQAAHSWPDNRLIWLESVSSRPGTSRGRSPLRQFTQNCRVMQESPTTGVPNHLVLSIVRTCSRVKLFTHLFWSFLPLREFGHHHVPGSWFFQTFDYNLFFSIAAQAQSLKSISLGSVATLQLVNEEPLDTWGDEVWTCQLTLWGIIPRLTWEDGARPIQGDDKKLGSVWGEMPTCYITERDSWPDILSRQVPWCHVCYRPMH